MQEHPQSKKKYPGNLFSVLAVIILSGVLLSPLVEGTDLDDNLRTVKVISQTNITGIVTETITNKPVMYATVYVNGTTIGTITNPAGRFSLDNVIPPCEIVISHVSYDTEIIELKQYADTVLQIKLNPRDVELGVVEVKDKNLRDENLNHFKKRFLGDDSWGRNAFIENDSVLVFQNEKVMDGEDLRFESEFLPADSSSILFNVNAKAALLIHLPLLGYKLHINLIHYTELQTGNVNEYRFHTLGYFYFQPEENASKRKTNRFMKKRMEAYYNSDRHFCRSLFLDQLKENGYEVLSSVFNPETLWYDFNEFDFDKHLIRSSNEVKIIGLKNKSFLIKYFEKFNRPVSLITRDGIERPFSRETMVVSKIYFLKDTCTIRADGSRPDNSVMFGPKMGNKRVGAMLPDDFQPEM
jgi:hypothetical protein